MTRLPAPPPAEAVLLPACLVAALRAGSPDAGALILAFTHASDLRRLGGAISARQLAAAFRVSRHAAARVLGLAGARPHDQGTTPAILEVPATPESPATRSALNADYRGGNGHSLSGDEPAQVWPGVGHTIEDERQLSGVNRPHPEGTATGEDWPTPGHTIEVQPALSESIRPPRPHDPPTTPIMKGNPATSASVADPRPAEQGTTPIFTGESATASKPPKRTPRRVAEPRPHDRGTTPLFDGVSATGPDRAAVPPPHPPRSTTTINQLMAPARTHTSAPAPTRARTRGEDRFAAVVAERARLGAWVATAEEIEEFLVSLIDDGGPPTLSEMAAWSDWLARPGCTVRNWRRDFVRSRRFAQGQRPDDDAPSGEHPPMTASAARGLYRGQGESPSAVRSIRQGDVPRDPDEPPLRGARPAQTTNPKTPGGDL